MYVQAGLLLCLVTRRSTKQTIRKFLAGVVFGSTPSIIDVILVAETYDSSGDADHMNNVCHNVDVESGYSWRSRVVGCIFLFFGFHHLNVKVSRLKLNMKAFREADLSLVLPAEHC